VEEGRPQVRRSLPHLSLVNRHLNQREDEDAFLSLIKISISN
jgi:hypothetical protein